MRAALALLLLALAAPAWAARVIIDCPSITWDATTSTATLVCGTGTAPPPTDPPPTDPPPSACPAGTLFINGQWGNTAIDTGQFGDFRDNIMVVRIDVPATWASTQVKVTGWAEYAAGPTVRQATLSTAACDFGAVNALKTSLGVAATTVGQNSIGFSFRYRRGTPTSTAVGMDPGKTYYLNVKNSYSGGAPSCTIANCRMIGGLPQ